MGHQVLAHIFPNFDSLRIQITQCVANEFNVIGYTLHCKLQIYEPNSTLEPTFRASLEVQNPERIEETKIPFLFKIE
jgi:hypothetical protein